MDLFRKTMIEGETSVCDPFPTFVNAERPSCAILKSSFLRKLAINGS